MTATDITTPIEAPAPAASAAGKRGITPMKTVQFVLLLIFGCVVLIPLYVVMVTSFKTGADVSPSNAWDLPSVLSTDGWRSAHDQAGSGPGTLAGAGPDRSRAVIDPGFVERLRASPSGSSPAPTSCSRLFLFGMFIPYQAVMIPLQKMLLDLQTHGFAWLDGIPKLILVHTIYGIPICTLIFRNYYATAVPNEILEAARVDGAGMIRTYWSIVLPVSMPAFVVTLIWQFTSAWNDFLFALFLSSPRNGPVTYALQELAGGQNPDYPSIMAGVLVASLPTLIVYIALGRYFISGLMSGSVK